MLGFVTLLTALAGGLWIDVPFTKQEKNGCGSASVWMVMEYWKRQPPPPEDIHRTLYSPEAGGVWAADMERYFSEKGFKTFIFAAEWQDLVENVSQGRPLIVTLGASARGAPLHYVVVAGVQDEQQVLLVNDPAERKLWPISRAEFEERWRTMDRWTLLAVPEDPSPSGRGIFDAPGEGSAGDAVTPTPELREASTAFRSGDYPLAMRFAKRAVQQDPTSATANELLATLYFLQNNVEAALKYWNRVDQPRLHDIRIESGLHSDPVLFERSMPLSRGSVIRLEDYRLARKRLDAADAFWNPLLELQPTEGQDFDLALRGADRRGLHWASWLRGLPYQTVTPSVSNISGRAINMESLLRWDSNKRRAFAAVSAPGPNDVRYRIALDFRDENWQWNGSRFRLWREELQAGLSRVATAKLTWSSAAVISRRSSGLSLKYDAGLTYDLWSVPEKRFALTSEARTEVAKVLTHDQRFARVEPGLKAHWLPQARGKDYETTIQVRAGRVFGDSPFDELFSIGLDRDTDLWMRAHPATLDGRKGAGLIGPRYFLWNSEVAKSVWSGPLIGVKLAPFADVARVRNWFVDAGVELRVSVASFLTVSLSAGRDMKTGRTVFFTNAAR
jgi:tetratricopeptide (TPR) repeat protein